MKFKDLMKVVNDIGSDLEYLRLKIFDLKVSDDLNLSDKSRLNAIAEIDRNIAKKSLVLNNISMQYLSKKHNRELNKPIKRGISK